MLIFRLFFNRLTATRKASTLSSAWQIHRFGEEELQLTKMRPVPVIQDPKHVLVKVHAASVNPIDIKMKDGYGNVLLSAMKKYSSDAKGPGNSEFPLTLGRDFSGVVVEVGKGVTQFRPGDEVWGAPEPRRQGTHAEYCVVHQSEMTRKPRNLSHVEAASLPYTGLTAWAAISTIGQFKPYKLASKNILVLGASGGVGTFAVQLLKAYDANVVATCSSDAASLVTALGADSVVDYRSPDVFQQLQKFSPYDLILDTVGNDLSTKARQLLKTDPRHYPLVTIATPLFRNTDEHGLMLGLMKSAYTFGTEVFKTMRTQQGVRWAFFLSNEKALHTMASLVEQGKIKPVIGRVFSFDQVPEAFEFVKNGHMRGKAVIKIRE